MVHTWERRRKCGLTLKTGKDKAKTLGKIN
jgi:hypothetical protein